MRFFISLAALAASTMALTITSPTTTNEKVDFSEPFTIRWTAVEYALLFVPMPYLPPRKYPQLIQQSSSDPQNFTITLVNQLGHRVNKDLATKVDASDEEYIVKSIADVPVANNYQINFRSTDRNNIGLLAQSPMFNVTKVADKEEEETETPRPNATATASSSEPTETNAASGKGGFVASGLLAGVLGAVVLAL
ncbi:hypothetical protein BJX70DRAFT_393829 [Aspergillus crustosus]